VAYITAAGLLAKPIKNLTDVNEKIQRGIAAAYSVFELLDLPEEKNTGTLKPELKGNIRFDHVGLVYKSDVHAIQDFTLNIKSGETIALVRRSGAGKTSLVNLLVRFQETTSGQIYLDDFVLKISICQLYVADCDGESASVLFNRTVRDNIAMDN
jgi:subfamily B ATP-binding cassette protein MsbA